MSFLEKGRSQWKKFKAEGFIFPQVSIWQIIYIDCSRLGEKEKWGRRDIEGERKEEKGGNNTLLQ